MGAPTPEEEPARPRRASVGQVVRAVFWSFLGIRKRSDHESDAVRISPIQAIVAGLIGAALFVATLIVIVKLIVGRAVA